MKLHCVDCGKLRNTNLFIVSEDSTSKEKKGIPISIKVFKDTLKKGNNTSLLRKDELEYHSYCPICTCTTVFVVNENSRLDPIKKYYKKL